VAAANNQGCPKSDPFSEPISLPASLSSGEMSLEASLTANSTESHSITSGLSAGFEAYITEARKRTDVMTCLFLFHPATVTHKVPNRKKRAKRKPSE
jgi:hypothetical protein